MHYKKLLIGALTAAVLTLAPALGASAAPATDTNPLVQNGEFKYNGSVYSLNVTPSSGSKYVTRDSYRVSDTYNVRITKDEGAYGKLTYSGKLGYTRTAYLHTKVIGLEGTPEGGLNLQRDYGITTYIKKVVGFSVSYDRARLDTLVGNYRKSQLRSDVTSAGLAAKKYIIANGSLAGVQNDKSVVATTDGYFGYSGDNVNVRLFVDPADSTNQTYEVVGLEKPDLYQSVFDSYTGATRSGTIDTVSNIN